MAGQKLFGVLVFVVGLTWFWLLRFGEATLVQDEVDALEEIVKTMGATRWKFNAETCVIETIGASAEAAKDAEGNIDCQCNNGNDTDCHVVKITLKGYNLPGVLPTQLVKLPYLREIDFAYNYLNGSIPLEWSSTQLTSISLPVNRLSGEIPKELGNIITLTNLTLEANRFSGPVPSELGKLVNLSKMILSSNQLLGSLPRSFARLINLEHFRINDNNFTGVIPSFIQNWRKLTRLEMHASGLEGPIPSSISLLNNLQELRISDTRGPSQKFPELGNMTGLVRLILRNCNISGEIPPYIWSMKSMELLDLSFNKLVGKIPATIPSDRFRFIFLTGNSLSGEIPSSILIAGTTVDLSYNNFDLQGPEQPSCRENMNLNLNLFRSANAGNHSSRVLPCSNSSFSCPRYMNCFFVNTGGKDLVVKENKTSILFEGDGDVEGGAAKLFFKDESYWGFSSTGDYMDDFDYQNTRYIVDDRSLNVPELYSTARKAPISLTYFHYCLENGKYTVSLQFSEIQFTNDQTFNSEGRRIFDVYVQERLVWKDLDIEREAGVAQKPLVKEARDIDVTDHVLEIRFYFAGKGTTRIPQRGVYGPIIAGISVASDLGLCSIKNKTRTIYVVAGVVAAAGALCLAIAILLFLWWRGLLPGKWKRRKDSGSTSMPQGTFSLKQIRAATNDFDPVNKIGEGGFGPVYKGLLPDGTVVAVKQLSSRSRQGNKEFLNEIGMISCFQHPNLVKLHGFSVESDQLLLVYEYMENNNLARALFNQESNQLKLDWPTRVMICTGIAKGLAYLHEESRLKIVHRDIKATNVLLDKELNPKISDFGLARLDEEGKTHISTRIAGTIGYMAPEYALWGHLTYKADVYSFGVVALELVSGRSNNNFVPSPTCVCVLDWACDLQKRGRLVELVDERLNLDVNIEEVEAMVKVAILCTNASPSIRPTMSEVVNMLEGRIPIPDTIPEAGSYTEDLRFKAMRDLRKDAHYYSSSSLTHNSTTINTFTCSSASEQCFYVRD